MKPYESDQVFYRHIFARVYLACISLCPEIALVVKLLITIVVAKIVSHLLILWPHRASLELCILAIKTEEDEVSSWTDVNIHCASKDGNELNSYPRRFKLKSKSVTMTNVLRGASEVWLFGKYLSICHSSSFCKSCCRWKTSSQAVIALSVFHFCSWFMSVQEVLVIWSIRYFAVSEQIPHLSGTRVPLRYFMYSSWWDGSSNMHPIRSMDCIGCIDSTSGCILKPKTL